MGSKKFWMAAGLMVLLPILHGCGEQANGKAEDELVTRVPVQATPVELGEIAANYSGTATLEAERAATVVAKTSGVLLELLAQEGDVVVQGDPLARLESEREQLAVDQAKANLERLKSDYQRMRTMHERQLISTEQFDQARFQFEAQQAQYELAQLELAYTTVRAPIGGVVARRLVKEGNLIQQNQAVFEVLDFTPLHAVLYVPEQQLGLLEPGLPVSLETAAYPDKTFQGQVLRTSPVVDAASGTFQVTVEIPNAEKQLKPGMFVTAHIIYERHQGVHVIPRVALIHQDGSAHVFVVEDGKAHKREVRLGFSNEGMVEVLDGLQADDKVVTIGQASLREGTAVQVVEG